MSKKDSDSSAKEPIVDEKRLRKREQRLQERLQKAQDALTRAQDRLRRAEERLQKRRSRLERLEQRLISFRQQREAPATQPKSAQPMRVEAQNLIRSDESVEAPSTIAEMQVEEPTQQEVVCLFAIKEEPAPEHPTTEEPPAVPLIEAVERARAARAVTEATEQAARIAAERVNEATTRIEQHGGPRHLLQELAALQEEAEKANAQAQESNLAAQEAEQQALLLGATPEELAPTHAEQDETRQETIVINDDADLLIIEFENPDEESIIIPDALVVIETAETAIPEEEPAPAATQNPQQVISSQEELSTGAEAAVDRLAGEQLVAAPPTDEAIEQDEEAHIFQEIDEELQTMEQELITESEEGRYAPFETTAAQPAEMSNTGPEPEDKPTTTDQEVVVLPETEEEIEEDEKDLESVMAMIIANAAAEAEAIAEVSSARTREARLAVQKADEFLAKVQAAIHSGSLTGEEAAAALKTAERDATHAHAVLADAEAAEELARQSAMNAEAEAEVAEGMAFAAHAQSLHSSVPDTARAAAAVSKQNGTPVENAVSEGENALNDEDKTLELPTLRPQEQQ